MTLFRLDASIRHDGSVSRQVADTLQAAWQAEHPHARVVRRDVGARPLPIHIWLTAATTMYATDGERSPEQLDAMLLGQRLAQELIDADAYVFSVPLYNYGVPQQMKGWVDLMLTDPRMLSEADKPLAGRPAALVVARGGGYGPGTPKEGWDHATPWLRRIFGDVLGLDLRVVGAELTLADVNPAMASLRGLADQSLREAHTAAQHHGQEIAQRVRTAAA